MRDAMIVMIVLFTMTIFIMVFGLWFAGKLQEVNHVRINQFNDFGTSISAYCVGLYYGPINISFDRYSYSGGCVEAQQERR